MFMWQHFRLNKKKFTRLKRNKREPKTEAKSFAFSLHLKAKKKNQPTWRYIKTTWNIVSLGWDIFFAYVARHGCGWMKL